MDVLNGTRGEGKRSASVLVLQNGVEAARALSRRLQCRFPSELAGSAHDARQILERGDSIVGALVDPKLPDGDGFEIIAELKRQLAMMPILIVTTECQAEMLSRAHLADVPLVHTEHCEENLSAFATEVNTAVSCARSGLDEVLAQICHNRRLSLRESQILRVAAHGIPRSRLATRLGTSENTVKSQIRSLLDKTQQPNLSEAVWLVHSQTDCG
jgi:DNA-binding NarL/FixJ family response regulator